MEKYLPTGDKERDSQLPGMGGVFTSMNLAMYTYTHQNPVKLLDPDGNAVFDNAEKLTNAANSVLKDPTVKPGYLGAPTWCNRGVGLIEKAGGNTDTYSNGQPGQYLRANDMVAKLQTKEFGATLTPEKAVSYAKQGATVIAGASSSTGSGHVAVVAPIDGVKHPKRGYLPYIFNVGKSNELMGVNYGFNMDKTDVNYYISLSDKAAVDRRGGTNNAPLRVWDSGQVKELSREAFSSWLKSHED